MGSATVSVAESGVAPDFRSASPSFVRRLRKAKFSARRRKPRARRPRSPERQRLVVALQCRPAAPSGRLCCSGVPQRALGYDHFLLKGLEKVRAEWSLITLTYNLKRVLNLVSFETLMAAVS